MTHTKQPDAEAYPLYWPEGWERTEPKDRERGPYTVAPGKARDEMLHELELMGATYVVLSSNVPIRRDGLPYANAREPDDPGVAVYWWDMITDQPMSIACDCWDRSKDNVRAIGLTIKAMRAIHRSGASQILHRAYSAFTALPADAGTSSWRAELGIEPEVKVVTEKHVMDAYHRKARERHPDHEGGSHEAMIRLNQARDAALEALANDA